ncbi:major facilitator superfamily domain-containing protein [Pisolithus croceorrhizus]|nr:major facilitator superfamily domain-containing protein [Pisolithus croceorrhizus]KAI6130178.1 major facilitator superfamily domain-containing protein [Pisolithus croceorrhizus]
MGILSCLVTGWWANFSDRYGRRPVFVASMTGLLLVDSIFIITANFVDFLPGGYWFLLVGFVLDGLLGSTPTAVAVNHAYLADTCEPSARSQMFAFALGLTFTGFAVGPLLGGFLIHLTGSTLSVFYMALSIHLAYALFLLFVLPESLTEAKARAARLRYKQERERNADIPTLSRVFKEATRFLSALAVLLPRDIMDADPLKRSKKDWNLFLLAISYAFSTSLMALMPFLIQYAIGVFRWSAETANYYFSLVGITRAVVLTVILPLMIKFLKSRKALTSHTPLSRDEIPGTTPLRQSLSPLPHSVNVDLIVARCAVSLEILACWVMATATTGAVFAVGTIVGAMSVASSPTIQALAVEVYYSEGNNGVAARGRQGGIGKLFGALSVLQALGAQIIAPAVYGFIYSRTVATFPQAILLVTAFCFTAALVLLACVRIPTSSSGLVQSSRDTEEGRSEGRNEDSTEGVLVDVAVEAHEYILQATTSDIAQTSLLGSYLRAGIHRINGGHAVEDMQDRAHGPENAPLIGSGQQDDEVDSHSQEMAPRKRRPWWKRPSPYWIIFFAPISSIGYSAAFAPRVEVYTLLVCHVHKPGYFSDDLNFGVTTYMTGTRGVPNINIDTRERCAADPEVQAIVAKLSATLVTTMGILSCLTTGWWGAFSDRHGRRSGLTASMTGLILTDLTFIVTANLVDRLPGGYWFLLVAFVIEGCLGSMPTGMAAYQAYIADTSDSSSRSVLYAFGQGLLFFGFAVGPLMGGFVIHVTGTTLSVFFLATALHLFYLLFIMFFLPESLTVASAHTARSRYEMDKQRNANVPFLSHVSNGVARFFDALGILLPRDVVGDGPLGRRKTDRSLLFLAISYGMAANFLALMPFVFQYVTSTFGWTSETTNYYFASASVTHALVLAVLLPVVIKFLKSTIRPSTHTAPAVEGDPYRPASVHASHPNRSSGVGQQPSSELSIHTPNIELTLARCALAIEVLACGIMATAGTGSIFVIGTIIGSFSIAFTPITQALALDIYTSTGQGETGKLFAVLSISQALGQQIVSPAVYGFVYSHTVATFPQAIFVVTAICFTIALVLVTFVKIPSPVLSGKSGVPLRQHVESGVRNTV